jgi:hypothetical protein
VHLLFLLAPNAGLPIRPVDARLQNESVEAFEEQDASRDSPERSSSSYRHIPAGALKEGLGELVEVAHLELRLQAGHHLPDP